ncbi:MAG: hypothetical protein BJ554DRAFT_8112 [Olpidium bornovanus]|uniref:DM10 domain-containing protein n=1 Tax=Olpidium bornovanus TaxID=278681 RepID=A0A8H8DIJ6_9FUNG|nr:MAG: hypothetical protein BJ554DRAFT_8112 [Olpidium bornovanus]
MVHWSDLGVGATIDVMGRKRSCDEYTKQFFKQNLRIAGDQFAPASFPQSGGGGGGGDADHAEKQQQQQQPYPPYNGFGSEEDSLGSCKYLVLKPPKKDFLKLLENEKKILRFLAVLDEPSAGSSPARAGAGGPAEDADGHWSAAAVAAKDRPPAPVRMFVLSYYLSDDTLSLYEPPARNSGFTGGKFLERSRCLKPGRTPQDPAYYEAQDLYVGAMLMINNHKFWLAEADEDALRVMEEHSERFWRADRQRVRQHFADAAAGDRGMFAELAARLRQHDKNGIGWVDSDLARAMLDEYCGSMVSRHV